MYNSEQFTPNPEQWWDTKGPFWTLHAINPLRVNYIQQHLQQTGLLGLDIGCGGGILTEELAKHHSMTGIDIDKNLIKIAKTRRPDINYLALTSDQVSEQFANKFDFITCLEVLEHVENPRAVIADIKKMLKPNGFIFYSTLNRNQSLFWGQLLRLSTFSTFYPSTPICMRSLSNHTNFWSGI